jgi:hypothetical protein
VFFALAIGSSELAPTIADMMLVVFLGLLLLQAEAQSPCNGTFLFSNPTVGALTTTDTTSPRLGLRFTSAVAGCLLGVRFNLVGASAAASSNVTVEACVCTNAAPA